MSGLPMTAANGHGYESAGNVWRFAECEFDERRHELRVRGSAVELETKPLEVLHQLLINAGEVVTKQELIEAVWPAVMVVDGSLATAVSKLRKALGQDQQLIVTVPRVGYRLDCTVEAKLDPAPALNGFVLRPGDPVPGREQWRLVRRLDAGPSGRVWLAEHPKSRTSRVFKFADDDMQLRALKREVTLLRVLREQLGERPEFVRILEWNFDAAPYFIEFEYGGANLAEWAEMQGGLSAVPLQVRLQLLIDIARAVADAHQLGVLHKDIKPGNILVSETDRGWGIKIADFGSGTLLDLCRLGALGITNAGFTRTAEEMDSLTGTMFYLSPEVLAGQSPTQASDVYALGVLLYQLMTGEFRKPLSPGWEREVQDPLLCSDIAEAACGDPARRMQSAADLTERLINLEKRRAELKAAEIRRAQAEAELRSRAAARVRRPWMMLGLASVLVTIAVLSWLAWRSSRGEPRAIAVLPFQNAGGDTTSDFLRFALPDEIATTLSHMQSITIRPFSATNRYAGPGVDLRQIGHDVQASTVVTGHYMQLGETLQITVEASNVEQNRLLWRDTFNVPSGNLIAMQAQVSGITRGKMGPALGASGYVGTHYAPPKNQEAYNLFLRSLGVFNVDSRENEEAVSLLEQSVALDGSYAPAWTALAVRLYGSARFRGGGERLLERSDDALEHALALDPDSIGAANELILHRTERGDLVPAYQQAQALLARRPDSAIAHQLVGYVLRYAGLLQESAKSCETGAQLDTAWPSCSTTYMQLGDYARARSVLRNDLGSEWSRAHGIEILLRQGKTEEMLKLAPPKIPGWESYRMLMACARHEDPATLASEAADITPDGDPEVSYLFAGHLAYCGQSKAAIHMLTETVAAHYCSYPALDLDPVFQGLRSTPEFAQVRRAAMACQAEFVKSTNFKP
jgi:serine/threonine protein kinase/DNA-binding winged helix-turn-helix (wHTH) protein